MPRGRRHSVGTNPDFDTMRVHRPIVAAADIVFARPDQFDRRAAQALRNQGRFARHMGIERRPPAKTAAGIFGVKRDLLRF